MSVHIKTVRALKIIGIMEIPMRFAYTGEITSLSIIQSRFKAISAVEPTFSYVS